MFNSNINILIGQLVKQNWTKNRLVITHYFPSLKDIRSNSMLILSWDLSITFNWNNLSITIIDITWRIID